jgi:hypothetical protein
MVNKTSPKKKLKIRKSDLIPAECLPDPLTTAARALLALEDHFALCRRYGVLEWDGEVPGTSKTVKFQLASALASDPSSVAPSTPQVTVVQASDTPKTNPQVGADGLYADMQEELLGRVMDAKR